MKIGDKVYVVEKYSGMEVKTATYYGKYYDDGYYISFSDDTPQAYSKELVFDKKESAEIFVKQRRKKYLLKVVANNKQYISKMRKEIRDAEKELKTLGD